RCSQGGLTVVNVTNGAHINVRLCAFEFFLGHSSYPYTRLLFLNHGVGDVSRHLCILGEFHTVGRPPLGG
ncbi:hypothetical protein Ga0074115_1221, partial [endosymbiont of Ridgeia piscesae]